MQTLPHLSGSDAANKPQPETWPQVGPGLFEEKTDIRLQRYIRVIDAMLTTSVRPGIGAVDSVKSYEMYPGCVRDRAQQVLRELKLAECFGS